MKIKILTLCLLLVFVLSPTVSAGTIGKGHKGRVAITNEPDGYNPGNDQLPGWLILPDGVDENSIRYSNDSKNNKVLTSSGGGDKWIIKVAPNDKKATYTYYLNNTKQYSITTSDSYSKVIIRNAKNKKVKTVSGQDFFNEAVDLNIKVSKPWFARSAKTDVPNVSNTIHKSRKNTKLSKRQLERLAHEVGFRGYHRKVAVAVASAESLGRVGAVLCNFNGSADNPAKPFAKGVKECKERKALSVDRGLWQINDYWHKKVKDKCAFSARCNAKSAYRISNGGTEWQWWSTYQNGSYKQYL